MNTADLSRLISLSFTGGELRALAAELGAEHEIDWERGTADAARDLLRHFERKDKLNTLLQKLRDARPLVEWPADREQAAPAFAPPPAASPALPTVEALSPPASSQSVSSPGAGPLPAKPDPYLSPRWPGTTDLRAGQEKKRFDPKIIGAVVGLIVLAAVIAFFIGRAGSSDSNTKENTSKTAALTASAGASAKPPSSARPRVPAWVVSAAIAKGLANVARNCELPINPDDPNIDESVISRALALCGRSAQDDLPPQRPIENQNRANEPQRKDIGEQAIKTAEKPIQQTGPKTQPNSKPKTGETPPAGQNGGGCLSRCGSEHNSCKSQCGKEPTESSLYEQFQSCNSRCLVAFSACKRSCQ